MKPPSPINSQQHHGHGKSSGSSGFRRLLHSVGDHTLKSRRRRRQSGEPETSSEEPTNDDNATDLTDDSPDRLDKIRVLVTPNTPDENGEASAPGNWGPNSPLPTAEDSSSSVATPTARANMPLEPEEYQDNNRLWIVDQMRMGEQPFSRLFDDHQGVSGDMQRDASFQLHEKQRQRKLAFAVLKSRVAEARVGIPREPPAPTVGLYKRMDGTVDYVAYACGRAKHYADTELQHKIDYRHSTEDPCKLNRFLSTVQRLIEISAPYQRLLIWLFKLARWDNPKRSATWCCVYFLLLHFGMLAMFLWLVPVFVIVYYRLRPGHAYQWLAFERPETSVISGKDIHDAASGTIAKGVIANRLWEMWRETLGSHVHVVLADVADRLERAKNCVLWKRPWASRATLAVLIGLALLVCVVPASVFQRICGILFGVQFFFLAPLLLRYQRYRHMLLVVDYILWHNPTDVELAVDTLYVQHDKRPPTIWKRRSSSPPIDGSQPTTTGVLACISTVISDLIYAYYPFKKEHHHGPLPITILQTSSSTAVDRLGEEDDIEDASGFSEALLVGRDLGKLFIQQAHGSNGEKGNISGIDEGYGGLLGGSHSSLPSVMGEAEEKEWARFRLLKHRSSQISSAEDTKNMAYTTESGDDEGDNPRPTMLRNNAKIMSQRIGTRSFDHLQPAIAEPRSLTTRAKGLTNRLRHRLSHSSDMLMTTKLGGDSMSSSAISTRPHSADSEEGSGASIETLESVVSLSGEPQESSSAENSLLDMLPAAGLELTNETKKLSSLQNKDAQVPDGDVDLESLHAFRCLHQSKYGTLFVTPDKFIFRRSRLMGGRRSSVASYPLNGIVAIRKSTARFGRTHGIQILMSNDKFFSFYGLGQRDDAYGVLMVRAGNSHAH